MDSAIAKAISSSSGVSLRAGVDLVGALREVVVGGVRRKGGDLATAGVRATEDCDEDLATVGRAVEGAALGVGLLERRALNAAPSVPGGGRRGGDESRGVSAGVELRAANVAASVPGDGKRGDDEARGAPAGVVPPSGASCPKRLMRRLTLEPVP